MVDLCFSLCRSRPRMIRGNANSILIMSIKTNFPYKIYVGMVILVQLTTNS